MTPENQTNIINESLFEFTKPGSLKTDPNKNLKTTLIILIVLAFVLGVGNIAVAIIPHDTQTNEEPTSSQESQEEYNEDEEDDEDEEDEEEAEESTEPVIEYTEPDPIPTTYTPVTTPESDYEPDEDWEETWENEDYDDYDDEDDWDGDEEDEWIDVTFDEDPVIFEDGFYGE